MPLDYRTRLDLLNTDPNFLVNVRGGPDPQDEYLGVRLGNDYEQYKQMRRDPHVRSTLRKLRQSILGRRVIVEAADDRRVNRQAAIELKRRLPALRYEGICSALLNSGQLVGFSVLRCDWHAAGEAVKPATEFVPQNRFSFAYHDPTDRSVPVCTGEQLDPASEIILVQGYELRLLTRSHPLTGERCPKNRFVVYTYDADESPWGLGLGYSIFPWWTVKREAMRAWLLHSDRTGSPPVLGTHPPEPRPIPGQPENTEAQAALRAFENFLKAVSPAAWARLPVGFTATVMDAIGQTGPEVHRDLIQMADNQISKVVLGEIPYSDKGTGSYAANESQVEDRESALIDAECNHLDEQLGSQLWQPYCLFNFPRSEAPTVRRESRADIREQDAQKKKREEQKAIAECDDILINKLGLTPSEEYIRETYGEEWTWAPKPPAPPPAFREHDFRAVIDRVVKWRGLNLGLEYKPGQVRFRGTKHERKLRSGYGHIRGYVGADGEALDCYIAREVLDSPEADKGKLFQVTQLSPEDGDFDEYKFMVGWNSTTTAKAAYLQEMPAEFFGGIEEVSIDDLEEYRKEKRSARSYAEPIDADGELLDDAEWDAIAAAAGDDAVVSEAMEQLEAAAEDGQV